MPGSRLRLLPLAAVLVALPIFLVAQGALCVTFTHGVASGDVTPFSIVLWTRVDQEASLTVEVSTDPTFKTGTRHRTVLASADNDFTARVVIAPLRSDHQYYYRWRHGGVLSEVGKFKTAPPPWVSANVRFAYSGDSDGTKVGDVPVFNNFETLDAAREEGLDFFVYLGDTVYADSEQRTQPAESLDEYREVYKENRDFPALRNLLKATSIYAIWDDHEVRDDFAGQSVDPTLYATGRKAFLEYMPLLELPHFDDSTCAGTPLFRVFSWGKDVLLIILDERSCRSRSAVEACTPAPGLPPDPLPTLPDQVRESLGLPASPPDGCREALFDPSRTMLGSFQKAVLKLLLRFSPAKFKFIINEVSIQQYYGMPYDRWEGYGAERNEILRFIRDNDIENVIFLTTDTHANLINHVFIDHFADPKPIAEEFVTGPIATMTLQASILASTDNPVEAQARLAGFNGLLDLVGVQCRNLDAYSYGLVEVDASAGTATITLKDVSDPQNPTVLCIKTIGP
jgi:alkaline phosphatase D